MGNFRIKENTLEFKINGADKFTSFVIVIFLLIITAGIIGFAVVLAENNFFTESPIYAGIILLLTFFILLILLLYLVKIGIFSRYIVKLDKDKIEIYDKRNDFTVMSENIDNNNLYIADTRQQIGYVSLKIKALCYGPEKQIFVEDRMPGHVFMLLCAGKKSKIIELKERILSIISK